MENPEEKMRDLKTDLKHCLRERANMKNTLRNLNNFIKLWEEAKKRLFQEDLNLYKNELEETEDEITRLHKEINEFSKKYILNKKKYSEYIKKENASAKKILKELHFFGANHPNLKRFPSKINKTLLKRKLLIARTLANIPKQIRDKVVNEVIFILIHKEWHGMCFEISRNSKTILLNFDALDEYYSKGFREPDSYKMGVVAHEIAHFILDHQEYKSAKEYRNAEKEAENLVESWGFKTMES